MKTLRSLFATAAVLVALTLLSARAHADPPQYRVIDLGDTGFEGGGWSAGINSSGVVCGMGYRSVRWNGKTPYGESVPALPAVSINDAGQMAGTQFGEHDAMHAVRWTGTMLQVLDTLGGTKSYGKSINAAGRVTGYAFLKGNKIEHAVVWTGTAVTDLGTLGGKRSQALGINASGQVAGWADLAGDKAPSHAVRWTGTTPEDLGTLGGKYSDGRAINDAGQVAGCAQLASDDPPREPQPGNAPLHAVRWTGNTPTDLGTLGGKNSFGLAINSAGDVVGMSQLEDLILEARPFLYTGGKMYDLTTLILPGSGVTRLRIIGDFLGHGNAINDRGQIAITGDINGGTHALRLDPVAKP